MMKALELASRGRWSAPPNPPVGAVVVAADGAVVGEGYHRRRGTPHAETLALDLAGEAARGATLYVTLEPCDHHGRTPPCSEAILEAGIRRVVLAMRDPHPVVAGSGVARLRSAGLDLVEGIGEAEARMLYERHARRVTEGRPAIIAKMARTLDGRVSTPDGEPLAITSVEAREWVGVRRTEVDGVLVGSGTILADDPLLNARDREGTLLPWQPARVVADARLRIPPEARLLSSEGGPVILVTAEENLRTDRARLLEERGARLIGAWSGPRGGLAPDSLVSTLADAGLDSILMEGGASLLSSLAAGDLVDLWHVFLGPMITGGGPGMLERPLLPPVRLGAMETRAVGPDLLISALPAPEGKGN